MTPRHVGAVRASDPEGITIDRKIPLWGLLTLAGVLLGQAVLMWNGQNLQAAEMRNQSEKLQELANQVKAMATQLATKDGVDIKQDLRIVDLDRRVTTLESMKR